MNSRRNPTRTPSKKANTTRKANAARGKHTTNRKRSSGGRTAKKRSGGGSTSGNTQAGTSARNRARGRRPAAGNVPRFLVEAPPPNITNPVRQQALTFENTALRDSARARAAAELSTLDARKMLARRWLTSRLAGWR